MALSLFNSDPFFSFWDLARMDMPRFEGSSAMLGSTDIKETDKEIVFRSDTPGMTKDDFKVQILEGNVLSISGERKSEKDETNDKYHRIERSYGKFTRSFRLPDNVDTSKIAAKCEHGVLNVTVPKCCSPNKKPADVCVS
jgi:HSP20 family protein